MDQGGPVTRVLIAASLLVLCGASQRQALPIREARWLKSDDVAHDLTHSPPECLALPKDERARRSVLVGRAMFRSPLLLGGQAARAGLSCSSCHRNGRTNPRFHFPGLSGAPGTADVTASLMSSHRGDGKFNPKPIPDLAAEPAQLKVKGTPKLGSFIHGLIVEEFDGPEPTTAVIEGLVAYVGAMSPAACDPKTTIVSLQSLLADVDAAVTAAQAAYRDGDADTGSALLAAARSTLGAIDERFELPTLESSRAELRDASYNL